jgi:hypothetical protein
VSTKIAGTKSVVEGTIVILGRVACSAVPEADKFQYLLLPMDARKSPPFDPVRDHLPDQFGHADTGGFRFALQRAMLCRRQIYLSANHPMTLF